ncbi:cell polarity protein [Schistosoma mansoni]|uniref:cell polarity protein n=1 Tax=Schistosoma mansoni TaxID=6183 RepID=UPI00022DC27B|nr:cell polarity protein [Schistosoma mansoni]|eukprot:XP_018649354.1 cell polarity protein [Schistosoma mansoni]
MKLTVCFGDTKVVVPCGLGNLTVRDLTLSGLRRVRHTLPKLGPQDRIVVHSINVARDGGMLDWDDLVCDVVDDREMVTAHFSIATLSNNVKDSCPNRPSTGLDSIFQSLSTPLVVDLCSDSALEPSFHSPIQSSGASEFRDSGLNLAPPCGIGLRQTDINGHIASRLLRIGDGSTSSSNLSLNLSNDSCGLHQPNGAHTSQFPGDIQEWFLNESSHDSNVALHPNTKVNCVSAISSSDNNKKCFTTSPASQSPPTCFNTASSTCEQMKSSPVSCNKSCLNSITINDTAKHCQRTLSPNVFEMLSNVLSRRRDLIESGWDSDDEDEDVFDPDGGYSYDCQVGKQQNELVSLPNGDTTLHLDTMNNNSDIIPNSLPGGNHCCLDVTESNSHHENINDNFPTVRYISVTSGTCDRPSNYPVISNADIWPLPPPPFSASDVPHVNIPTNLPFRVHSPEDEYHIGINTERLIRAVQSHNSFSNSNGPDRFCTTSDIEPNSLVNQSELRNPLSYSQPNLVTQYDDSIRQQNVQHLSNTHIAENNMVSNSLHQSGPDHVQSQYSHTCNVNSTKSLVITSRPVGGLSCSRTTTRLGIAFQNNLTVPTIVEEEEEYSVDSERRLPNLPENETEHQFIDMLRSRTNSLLNNNHIDINETNEEDYPLLRKDYVLEKDQTSVQKCSVLHVNTINNDKCNPSSNELHLSNVQLHSNDNPLITNNHSIRGLPKPDVIRWLENTRDATMSNNCQVVSQSSLSHLSSSASLNQSDFNTDDHRPINEVPEKIPSNIVESPSVNKSQESINSKDSIVTIRLINTKRGENLGIQIKPVFSDAFNSSNDNCSDNNGGSRIECGLEVHCILPNGRVAREQCLSVGDRILSINGISLSGIPFEKGRDIFQEALNEPEIILRVLPHSAYQYSSSLSIQNIDKIKATATKKSEKPSCGLIVIVSDPLSKTKEAEIKSNTNQLKPIPPPPPRRSPNTVLTRIPEGIIKPLIDEFLQEKKQQENNNNQLPSSQELTKSVVNTQTNIVNNNNSDDLHTSTYHTIHLCKGSNGLGFSLTSRDSLTSSGQKVICVKNILPGGAALIDGQLKPGDLLMKVDNINVNEIGQAQTVALLRSKPVNTLVTLVVKRSRNNSHNEDINNNNNNNDNSNNTNDDNNLDQACLPDLKTMQPSVICTIASSCCINTVNEQPTKSILSTIPPLSSTSQPITQQHNETVIVEQPSSHDIKIPDKLSEWNCCSSDISQKFHPLPPSHPSYKLHEIDSSHWSLYLLNIHLPLTKTNEPDKITTIRQDTDSTIHQSTIKRHTGNPATLGVSVSVRRLSNNSCVNNSDVLGGGLSSSTTTATANEKHSSVQIDKTNDSQWNAVFVRTVIDGGPAYQSNEEMSKTLHFKSNTCCNATVNVNNSHETTTKSASSLLLLCNTKTNGNNDENIDVNTTNHHNDANNCNNVTNSPTINNSFQYDPKTVNIDYCAVKNVQIPVTSCSTLKHLDLIPSSNSNGTSEHSHHHYRRRRRHHHYRVNEKFYLNSKCCYSNLDQSSKKRLSNYSSSSTEILCNYQHNLYDSDLNYDATTLSDPETERYSYKLDLFSELSLSSVSGDAGDQTLNMNIKKNPITNKSTLHKCYYKHGKYLSDKKCKYRVVYRQPRIDFSQMVLVPFDPASWNGPVLKPRTALNSEELQLIVDMPNSFSSLQNNNNNRVDQQPDKNIERRAHNSVVDVDSMYNKQNAKCIDNEAVRMRKAHPKTVISKLFSLVKTTAHRRTTGDQNTISDFENTAETQLPTDDSVRTILSSENDSAIEKRNNCLINLPNHANTLSTIQNHLYVESSTKNLLKPQSDQSIDLQLYANNKITNSNERSRSSCYATLHERLEPPIHIYDTAHNIQINNTNDHKSDLSNPSNEQVTLLDAKYPASFAPQINITQTTTENVVVNQPEDTSLTQLQTTKYADLSFLPNSSLNSPLSCMPLLLTNSNNTTTNNTDIVQTTTLFNKTIKELTSQQQQQSQHRSISSANQHHLTSLSKSTVNRLYDIEISSCSTAYESVMEYIPTCDDVTSKQKATREVYEDAEVLYRHLSDLKQSNNSDIHTTVIDSSNYH